MQQHFEALKKKVLQLKKIEDEKPLKVSIMGQTGVGKTSLINAIFQTNLETDPVKPCTKEIEKVSFTGEKKQKLEFYDLPGIGESEIADTDYLDDYLSQIKNSDVIIWAIHADNRSVKFDLDNLKALSSRLEEEEKHKFWSKITFILTKSDLIAQSPWVLGKISESSAVFSPSRAVAKILDEKEKYYRDIFILNFGNYITSTTYNNKNFDLEIEDFFHDDYEVGVKSYKSPETFEQLSIKYPQFKDIFKRLNQNFEVISCSSLFNFNLNKLLLVTFNKLGYEASGRFSKFINDEKLNLVPLSKARKMSNIIAIDMETEEILYDLSKIL